MSNMYGFEVNLEGYNPENAEDITDALVEFGDFEFPCPISGEKYLDAYTERSLGGGKAPDVFAQEMAEAAFKANGGEFTFKVTILYLEQIPSATIVFGVPEDD